MRPVVRGLAPRTYTGHRQARDPLAKRIGFYCSYCEIAVTNMIEVEHVVPISQGGGELDWNNFLLSCKYCNTNKRDNNISRNGYLWPDRDNTDLAFAYDIHSVIRPRVGSRQREADATILLMGLNRGGAGAPAATVADLRPSHRIDCWLAAQRALELYMEQPTERMAELVAIAAQGRGFYSIWMTVFSDYPQVQQYIRVAFPGTYVEEDEDGVRVVRPGGLI